jgi:hypothetical protein
MTEETGAPSAPALHTFGQFVAALENGELHTDLTGDLREISSALLNYVLEHGGSPKASLTLTLNFKLDKGVFEIDAKRSVKLPAGPRGRSVMYATPSNHFTPFNPKQLNMFGPGGGPKVIDGEKATKVVRSD